MDGCRGSGKEGAGRGCACLCKLHGARGFELENIRKEESFPLLSLLLSPSCNKELSAKQAEACKGAPSLEIRSNPTPFHRAGLIPPPPPLPVIPQSRRPENATARLDRRCGKGSERG